MRYKKLILRSPEPEDLELLFKWENDSSMWELSGTIVPFSRHTLRRYIEDAGKSIYEMGQVRLMIDLTTDTTIGTVDLFDFDPYHLRAGIGILIAEHEHRNSGYATMAIEGAIEYGFRKLKLHQLYCNILSDNTTSLRLFTKLGFKQVGIKKEWIRSDKMFKDEILLQLISDHAH